MVSAVSISCAIMQKMSFKSAKDFHKTFWNYRQASKLKHGRIRKLLHKASMNANKINIYTNCDSQMKHNCKHEQVRAVIPTGITGFHWIPPLDPSQFHRSTIAIKNRRFLYGDQATKMLSDFNSRTTEAECI